MSEITKQICPGFNLNIIKKLSDYRIDFILENNTDFIFLFNFAIKDFHNVKTSDEEMEKNVQVLPKSTFLFMNLQVEGIFGYKYTYKYQKLYPDPIVKCVEVAKNLLIYIRQIDLEQKIIFELCNNSSTRAHFELTVLELSGIKTFNGKNFFIIDIDPLTKVNICELYFDEVWSYKYSFTYAFDDDSNENPILFPVHFESSS